MRLKGREGVEGSLDLLDDWEVCEQEEGSGRCDQLNRIYPRSATHQ